MTIHVIIVAAGSGSRFGAGLPKQFCELSGRPVLMTTIDAFRSALPEANIILVLSDPMRPLWQSMCDTHGYESPEIVSGGSSRAQSVSNAVLAIEGGCDDIVMIHDGARPLVDKDTIERVVGALAGADGAIPAIQVTDSIRLVSDDGSSVSVDRSKLRAVQTPQAFWFKPLEEAYRQAGEMSFTDDASLMESTRHGMIRLVEGSVENMKITNPGDMEIARIILERRKR